MIPGQGLYQTTGFPSPNYYNNMNYGICVAKQPKMCAIKWSAIQFDFGGRAVGQSSTETSCVEYGLTDDIGDFIVIPISSSDGKTQLLNRYCGQRLNPTLDLTGQTVDADVMCMWCPQIYLFVSILISIWIHSIYETLPNLGSFGFKTSDQWSYKHSKRSKRISIEIPADSLLKHHYLPIKLAHFYNNFKITSNSRNIRIIKYLEKKSIKI